MTVEEFIADARNEGRAALDEAAGKAVLAAFGIATPQSAVVTGRDQVAATVDRMSPPFVVKGISPDVLHKSDVGAVKLGLMSADEVASAVEEVEAALSRHTDRIDGYLIEEMAPKGHEVVVGAVDNPQFGPVVMVGLGGIFIEVLKDVSFRLCPLQRVDAEEMIEELRSRDILAGARGGIVADREALIETILKIGGEGGLFLSLQGAVSELDVNPLIVSDKGAVAVDARLVLAKEESHA